MSIQANDPCALCRCNCSTRPFNNFNANSPWIATIWTDLNWLASHPNRHTIFQIEGVSILTVGADLMHAEHLGSDQYFLASVLWLLCYEVLPGAPSNAHLSMSPAQTQSYLIEHIPRVYAYAHVHTYMLMYMRICRIFERA